MRDGEVCVAGLARRQWMRRALGIGAALALPSGLAAMRGDLQWRERALIAMGTGMWLRAGHASAIRAEAALDAGVAAIRHVERQMNLYDARSALSHLNRERVLARPHPDMVQVLRLAQRVSARSAGAFDVTVQPLWAAWRAAQQAGRLPSVDELRAARARVGWRKLDVAPDRVRLLGDGMALTLNGIAQGYAADLACAALRRHGVEHALLDTGEWMPLGQGPDAAPWTLGVADPRRAGRLIATMITDGRAVATSSDANYRFGADAKHHHILDPRTGYSPPELASVTVVAQTCTLADALTKVVFMAGAARALNVARQWSVDVLAVDKSGRWQASPGLAARLRRAPPS